MTIQLPDLGKRGMTASVLLTDADPAHLRPGCPHTDDEFELRTMMTRNGIKLFKFQCQVCGDRGTAIPRKHRVVIGLTSDPPPIDEELQRRHWTERFPEQAHAIAQERAEWWEQYTLYLKSEKWRRKRARVLVRDKYVCQAAMDGCVRSATEVHHLTYRHVFDEPLFDLIAVCWRCHEKITAIDRDGVAA